MSSWWYRITFLNSLVYSPLQHMVHSSWLLLEVSYLLYIVTALFCIGLIVIHEHLFQLINTNTTPESLELLSKEVAACFYENHYHLWEKEVRKKAWWMKDLKKTVNELTELIMKHQMVSKLFSKFLTVLLIVVLACVTLNQARIYTYANFSPLKLGYLCEFMPRPYIQAKCKPTQDNSSSATLKQACKNL